MIMDKFIMGFHNLLWSPINDLINKMLLHDHNRNIGHVHDGVDPCFKYEWV